MNEIDTYIESLPEVRKERFRLVSNYIHSQFPHLKETCHFSPKSNFPTWVDETTNLYVAMASMKNYISIHFANPECVPIVVIGKEKIAFGVGCVKIPDNALFPLARIEKAINICFNQKRG